MFKLKCSDCNEGSTAVVNFFFFYCGLYNSGLHYWQGQEIFFFSKTSRLALEPTLPAIKWVLELFPLE